MKKVRPVVARNARELAKVLGLSPRSGRERMRKIWPPKSRIT